MLPMRGFGAIVRCLAGPGIVIVFAQLATVAQTDIQRTWQEEWSAVMSGDTIHLPEGTFQFDHPLSLDGKTNVFIKGAGIGKTNLSFANQSDPGAAINISNGEGIRIEGFSVIDANGDAIRSENVFNIQYLFIDVSWTGERVGLRRGHGIRATQCQRVLLYESQAVGTPEAGFYVSECEQVVVRKCKAERNGVGIEIVNTSYADVIDNNLTGNSNGILAINLPGLEKKSGGDLKIYHNTITENNLENNVVESDFHGLVPAGTGIMLVAVSDVKIYENVITNNQTMGTAIMSYTYFDSCHSSSKYNPYSMRIVVHDNTFSREPKRPNKGSELGKIIASNFGKKVPHIIYDGIRDEIHCSPTTGRLLPEYEICIYNNSPESFASLDAGNDFKNLSSNLSLFKCE